jgi:hypothetical protein
MGWSYRRSVKFGPFRLNLSKSGIGVSAGVRGARVSTGPGGTHLNLGTNGFYYRQKIDGPNPTLSSSRGSASLPPLNAQYFSSLPSGSRYPEFPKHGPPRIVKTLGYLSIPAAVIFLWILTAVGVSTNFNFAGVPSNQNTRRPNELTPKTMSSRERGFQAGLDYASSEVRSQSQKLDQRRVKKLANQMSSMAKQDQEWELGWIEGYKKGDERRVASRANINSLPRSEAPTPKATPATFQSLPRPPSNGLIRGPRGGCYYISGSGRKVYVDRGLCN